MTPHMLVMERTLPSSRRTAAVMGALELIELGEREIRHLHAKMGFLNEAISYLFSFVGNGLSALVETLDDLVEIPLSLVGSGVETFITSFASIVGNIPVIGEMVAAILLAANSIIQAAIELPGQILEAVGTLAQGFKTLTPEQQKSATNMAMQYLVDAAPEGSKSAVQQTVSKAPPPGSITPVVETEPSFGLAEVGVVVANAGLIAAALLL